MAAIEFDAICKRFEPGAAPALRDFSLSVADEEFLVMVGPSGCGKSTALRLAAGLEDVSSGRILLDDQSIEDFAPWERNLAMVFQSYALYPHLTVAENIAFPLKVARVGRPARQARAREVAELLDIGDLLDRKPAQISGGQRQRVAIGRALVRDPGAFLMDEPLSNLDAQFRVDMRTELLRLHREVRTTTLYVTHDQVEAMTMGDRIAVMRDGELQQVGTPAEVYGSPVNLFTATFIGSPPMNLFRATVGREDGRCVLFSGDLRLTLDRDDCPEGEVVAGVRPERIDLSPPGGAGTGIDARVELVEVLGFDAHLALEARLQPFERAEGERSLVHGRGSASRLIVRAPADLGAAPGDGIGLAVEPRFVHLFDPTRGHRI
jgi:multiple sugar transport system ATP-binding protein